MFSITAINDTETGDKWEPLAPTKEALEFHLSQSYHEGLLKLQAKDYGKAQTLLESVLKDPLVSSAQVDCRVHDGHLQQLRFLALKNLATVFLQQGPAQYDSALNCYLQAVEIDAGDSVVWNKLGTLSCSMGLLSTSRWAFEQGLFCSPNNWNCMEKLLEVLIAIKDEVACLSIADLILRHWPSHSRALHVKKTIENEEPVPFAPQGIDKLDPSHARLKFPIKRKAEDDVMEIEIAQKIANQALEICLPAITWEALANELLKMLNYRCDHLPEEHIATGRHSGFQSDSCNENNANFETHRELRIRNHETKNLTDVKLIIRLPPCPEYNKGSAVQDTMDDAPIFGRIFRKTDTSKEREGYMDDEHPHERRSTRLERLRSRKPGREELDSSNSKDPAKTVFKFLQPFLLRREKSKDYGSDNSYFHSHPELQTYSPAQEFNDVVNFVEAASKNFGVYHVGHMLLEEMAHKEIICQDSFMKLLDLEKWTRQWPEDRTPICSLFLAELFYDHGSSTADEFKRLELISEASYHLCKVIELVTYDSSLNFSHIMNNIDGSKVFGGVRCWEGNIFTLKQMNESEDASTHFQAENRDYDLPRSSHQRSNSDTEDTFWIRFFWLSSCLSLSSGCTAKAIEEFYICLSVMKNCNKLDAFGSFISLPYCRHIKWLNADRVLHQINLVKIAKALKQTTNDMIEKGMYRDCINLLTPILLSSTDVYPDLISGVYRRQGTTSVELTALDILALACERLEPMEIEVYLKCHRRKLQVLVAASGMSDSPASTKSSIESMNRKNAVSDKENAENEQEHWNHMVAKEVNEIVHGVTLVKKFIDHNSAFDFSSLICTVSDIQSLLLTVMSSLARSVQSQKLSGSGNSILNDQMETQCLVSAAIVFCRLQHLDYAVNEKNQVDLIVAIHDLLAEYGLCCAGKDSEGKEGTFLKLAIKHLLALDVKLKSSSHFKSDRFEGNEIEDLVCNYDQVKEGANQVTPCSVLAVPIRREEGSEAKNRNTQGETSLDCSSVQEVMHKNDKWQDSGMTAAELTMMQSASNNAFGIIDSPIDSDREKLELGIDNALDQSFFCLYGLNIKSCQDSSCEDDLAIHKNTNRGDYQTKEQCADVFQYILPYAKASSRAAIVKLKRVLRAIRKHFPQPPDDVLAENWIDMFLNCSNLCEDKLFELSELCENQDSIMSILYGDGRGEAIRMSLILSSGPYLEIYSNLYYFIAQAEDISATDKFPGFVLNKEGEEFVYQNASLFKYDLLYNPLHFESWQKLANIYDEEVDLLLNDGSKHINIVDWGKNATLSQRVEAGRRRSRRCLLMSLALATDPAQQSQIHELLGLVYYDGLQNVVPFYDQRSVTPRKDATWLRLCQNSMKHFEKAFALKPDWTHAFYLGKLSEKTGSSPRKALSYYEKAITLNSCAVDPFYRMHSSRLKFLYDHSKKNVEALKINALHSFHESTRHAVCKIFNCTDQDLQQLPLDINNGDIIDDSLEASIESHCLDEVCNLLYDDCLSALRVCVEGELKHYHKARYMLAQGLYKRSESGDLQRAKDELSFCFKSSRSSFTINMWEIDGTVKKGKKKVPNVGGGKKILEVSLPESSRKFISSIRKYLLLYLNLLEKLKDFCTLERAYVYLRTDRRFSLCLGDLAPLALGRYIKVLTLSICDAENTEFTGSSSSYENILERMFQILIDHLSMWAEMSSLPEIKCPELTETSLYGYIHQYIHSLESGTRLDALEAINEKIRKRFKNPKLANANSAKICKHASLAWCRSILVKLASITPALDSRNVKASIPCSMESELLLFVDVQTDMSFNLPAESSFHSKDVELKWCQALSRIRNACITQALPENMETANMLLRCAYNFYKESSCGAFPSGISLFTVHSSQLVAEESWQPAKHGWIDILELSIPRKLLLWSYTLIHGQYSNILTVVKYCEENAKLKVKRGNTVSSSLSPVIASACNIHTGCGKEKNVSDEKILVEESSPITHSSCTFPILSEISRSISTSLELISSGTDSAVDAACEGNNRDNYPV